MPTKCPECDWVIERAVSVELSERTVSVCCDDCADKQKIRDHIDGTARRSIAGIPRIGAGSR